jgi:hypothetical protein
LRDAVEGVLLELRMLNIAGYLRIAR